jgi:hypothetical protein
LAIRNFALLVKNYLKGLAEVAMGQNHNNFNVFALFGLFAVVAGCFAGSFAVPIKPPGLGLAAL